jgi:hypothetical protein
MKKIRLDLDMLSVETFSTTGAAEARGTVNAHRPDYTQGWDCESIDFCETPACPGTGTGTGTGVSECSCPSICPDTCYEFSCGRTMCDSCVTCGGNTCQGEASCSCWPCQY